MVNNARARLPRFVPILTSFMSRVVGRDRSDLLGSSAALARAIGETQKLVGNDGVLCLYDPAPLVSACIQAEPGQSERDQARPVELRPVEEIVRGGHLGAVLEAIPFLRHQLPNTALVFAALAGPSLLFSEMSLRCHPADTEVLPDYVTDAVLRAVRSALESGADGIALIEQDPATNAAAFLSSYKTVRKVVDFYEAAFLLFWERCSDVSGGRVPAHCTFCLPPQARPLTLVVGGVDPSWTGEVAPVTTGADVPADTPMGELQVLKARLQEVQGTPRW